jgi:hypothetical protein
MTRCKICGTWRRSLGYDGACAPKHSKTCLKRRRTRERSNSIHQYVHEHTLFPKGLKARPEEGEA